MTTAHDHAANPGRHALVERGADFYETPEVAVEALMRVEQLPHHIWEPACGSGNIVKVLREAGHAVWATDLNDHGCPDSEVGIDFLTERQARFDIEAVLTNPPYKLADQFVGHALLLAPKVIMLLRLAFLESKRRSHVLDNGQLKRVYVFRERLPMMHRVGWQGPRASSSIAFAWFVWDRNYHGEAQTRRISWKVP